CSSDLQGHCAASPTAGSCSTGTVPLGLIANICAGLFLSTISRSSTCSPANTRPSRARMAYGQRRKEYKRGSATVIACFLAELKDAQTIADFILSWASRPQDYNCPQRHTVCAPRSTAYLFTTHGTERICTACGTVTATSGTKRVSAP